LGGRIKVGVKEEEGLSTIYDSPLPFIPSRQGRGVNLGIESDKGSSCNAFLHLCGAKLMGISKKLKYKKINYY
jgi:hypothetical protein